MLHLPTRRAFALVLAASTLFACDDGVGPFTSNQVALPSAELRSDSAPVLVTSYSTSQQLIDRHATDGATPEGTLKLWLTAVIQYGSDNLSEALRGRDALAYLSIDFKDEPEWWTLSSYQTFVERTWTKPYIFRSYAVGATPENGYAIDFDAFELNVSKSEEDMAGDRGWAVHLVSGGADSPRPIYLKKSTTTGLYFLYNFDNAYVDIRQPLDPGQERFE